MHRSRAASLIVVLVALAWPAAARAQAVAGCKNLEVLGTRTIITQP